MVSIRQILAPGPVLERSVRGFRFSDENPWTERQAVSVVWEGERLVAQ